MDYKGIYEDLVQMDCRAALAGLEEAPGSARGLALLAFADECLAFEVELSRRGLVW